MARSKPIPKRKKKRRSKPGMAALREIRAQQKSVSDSIPRAALKRIVKDILVDIQNDEIHKDTDVQFRMKREAFDAIQSAVESFAVGLLGDTNRCAIHANRTTIEPRDMHLTRLLYNGPGHNYGQGMNLCDAEEAKKIPLVKPVWKGKRDTPRKEKPDPVVHESKYGKC